MYFLCEELLSIYIIWTSIRRGLIEKNLHISFVPVPILCSSSILWIQKNESFNLVLQVGALRGGWLLPPSIC